MIFQLSDHFTSNYFIWFITMASWKKPNTKRAQGKPNKSNGFVHIQSQKHNVQFTYTIEIPDRPTVTKTSHIYIDKLDSKSPESIIKIIHKKARSAAFDYCETISSQLKFTYTLTMVEIFKDGKWNLIHTPEGGEAADEEAADGEEADE